MSMVLPVHVFLSILILQALRITSLPEEAFFGYPLQTDEEYVYLDSRGDPSYAGAGASAIKQSETRRRSILDKNFARFGRSGGFNPAKTKIITGSNDPDLKNIMYLKDDDVDLESFGRNARSGERNGDQFIRFGRGKSDFVRFGRADGVYQRNRDFIRFGRSTRSVKTQKTNEKTPETVEIGKGHVKLNGHKMAGGYKMAANAKNVVKNGNRNKRAANLDLYKKSGSNFVRFGRERNDNFMRFGRMMNQNQELNLGGVASPGNPGMMSLESLPAGKSYNNTSNLKKYFEVQGQQGHELILKMLMDILTKSHLRKELQQLQQLQKNLESIQQDIANKHQNEKQNQCN